MITYIDSSNKQDYTVLFEKASAKLGLVPIPVEVEEEVENPETHEMELVKKIHYKRMVQENGQWTEVELDPDDPEDAAFISGETSKGISSLNEYFQHIEDLAALAIGNGRTGSDPYFLRVPLDEPFFEINANTRAISVPAELRQVGVVGDKFAEIVFFKIDRYFDAVDLNTRQIYIEWEAPDGNGDVIRGVSRDFLRDVQSEKDKIIFGWVIGDELTKNIGTIRFAVRFVEWNHEAGANEDEASSGTSLAYSFSSLPAQITVVDSLHYDLFEDSEEAAMIDTDGQASTILFFLQNSDPDTADDTTTELAGIPVFIRDLIAEHDLENGLLRLDVEAVSESDSGSITYVFGRKAHLTGENAGTQGIVAKIDFIEVGGDTGVTPATGATLYIKKANGVFEVAGSDIPEGAPLYEKVAYMIAERPGYYFANARNTVSGKKTNSATSSTLYIPYAEQPVVKTDLAMPAKFVIKEKTYTEELDETVDQSKMPGAMHTNIKITEGEEGPATLVLGAESVGPQFTVAKSNGLLYKWYKATKADLSDAVLIPEANVSNYEVSAPGFYAVEVTNSYNNDTNTLPKEDASIGVIRVTNMPEIPEVLFDDWQQTVVAGNPSTVIEIEETEHDHITYEWHRVTDDNTDLDPVAEGYMEHASGEVEFTNGIGAIPFMPLGEGFYYFILKNELNGASILMNSGRKFGTIYVTAGTLPPVTPGTGHSVNYSWAAGAPEVVANVELPDSASNVVSGTLIQPREIADVVVDGGKWVLSWTPAFAVMADEDIEFVGTWTFVEDEVAPVVTTKYHVTYEWGVAEGEENELPETGMPEAPVDSAEYEADDVVTLAAAPESEVAVDGGAWHFVAWDPASLTISDKDETIIGRWSFTAEEENPQDNG